MTASNVKSMAPTKAPFVWMPDAENYGDNSIRHVVNSATGELMMTITGRDGFDVEAWLQEQF